jgi:predicted ATP-dependent serine protease
VFTTGQYVADPDASPRVLASTSLPDLDQLTGGLVEGAVWVLAGLPRAGRTMLALQFSRLLAQGEVPVRYSLGVDPPREVIARVDDVRKLNSFDGEK